MGHEAIDLDEAALVEQQVEPFAGREFALLVLLRDPRRTTTLFRLDPAGHQIIEELSGIGHGGNLNRAPIGSRRDRRPAV